MTQLVSSYGMEQYGIQPRGQVYWNLSPAVLVEHAIRRGEGALTAEGPFNAITTPHTGRSPNDKFLVREPSSQDRVWWDKVNAPFDPEKFNALQARVVDYLSGRELFVRDMVSGADPDYRLRVRLVTESAYANLFAHNLFIRPERAHLAHFTPELTVLHAPLFKAVPARDGTRTETFILLNFARNMILIGGTRYAGEIKKSIFTVMNYLLPLRGVFPMHCSANVGHNGDVALFFGLSGTGKTTLSADPHRGLIGDDEHGWSNHGVFNLEGGCYAKVIHLSPKAEPQIFSTTRRFGTVLENVVVDSETRLPDFDSDMLTENTRAAYPLYFIENAVIPSIGGQPQNVFLLTADAFGVLPPISRLNREQAMYYFLSGYTAKVAGTERGVTEPQATFSACFGAPFMVLHPGEYARMLGERLDQTGAVTWLINTGWTGGPYGVGQRMKISYTRAMLHAALDGLLNECEYQTDPIFGLSIPTSCPGVPSEVLLPRNTWSNPASYDAKAHDLASRFHKNFEQFASGVDAAVGQAGPLDG